MVKIGQSDATVDPQFNQLEAQFKEQYHKVKKFGRFVEKYQAAVKGREQEIFFFDLEFSLLIHCF